MRYLQLFNYYLKSWPSHVVGEVIHTIQSSLLSAVFHVLIIQQ
jgi:hypothetical protein